MKKPARLKSQAGFSLIELMIVVAIIGILATVAIPNFQRFQAKARQSEVKTNLAGLYTAEKAFFAEWQTYTTSFNQIGFRPEGALKYDVGFSAANVLPTAGYTGPGAVANDHSTSAGYCSTAGAACSRAIAPGCGATIASAAVTQLTFTAAGAGCPLNTNSDLWTINETKTLTNGTSGI